MILLLLGCFLVGGFIGYQIGKNETEAKKFNALSRFIKNIQDCKKMNRLSKISALLILERIFIYNKKYFKNNTKIPSGR